MSALRRTCHPPRVAVEAKREYNKVAGTRGRGECGRGLEKQNIVTQMGDSRTDLRGRWWAMAALVIVAAVVMGAPTLRGTFVGGDDYRLVLDHVLVNHPSLPHAVKLFTILHRDLYQPVPLLSFSAEFAVAIPLGLFDEAVEGGAWLFHLTNVALHALNALLVFAVILALRGTEHKDSAPTIATIAGVLFAIHPLEVEVVAWINGRMMLLSTLFGLASLVTLNRWLQVNRHRWAVLTAVLVALSAMSKIRISLPVLLLIVPLARRRRITLRFIALWLVCAAFTGGFAVVNYIATDRAGMFSGAAESLHGPPVIRSILALAWYFQHFTWPTGLASWYPTPVRVHWSDPATWRAMAILVPVLVLVIWSAFRWRVARFGFVWFFVTIASTLQLVPTRNTLAADRYMYLPIIGLIWIVAAALYTVHGAASRRWPAYWVRPVTASIAVAVAVAMILTSWHTASFYETAVKKTLRIAELAPETPHVWERLAWALCKSGRYQEAIEVAQREFAHQAKGVRSEAYQVIGTAKLALGQHDDAIADLRRAIEVNPDGPQAPYHLAKALEELGHLDEAAAWYEESVKMAPLANPRLLRLAELYRVLGRSADARATYHKVLVNNSYDVKAAMGIAELDIEEGTVESYRAAEERLTTLLEWMPENSAAWVNLGVARHGLGRTSGAIEAYRRALTKDPAQATAALNLAMMYYETGDVRRAGPLFERAAANGLESFEEVLAVHDFLAAQGAPARAVTLWTDYLLRFPDSIEGRAFAVWSRAMAGEVERATVEAAVLDQRHSALPITTATQAFLALVTGRYEVAVAKTETLCNRGAEGADARERLLRALASVVAGRPDLPWTYCLAARLWLADGQLDNARAFIDLCDRECHDPPCRECVETLRARLPQTPEQPGG